MHKGLFSTPRKMRMAKSMVMGMIIHWAGVKTTITNAEKMTRELSLNRFSLTRLYDMGHVFFMLK
jgi:hypothetical protein